MLYLIWLTLVTTAPGNISMTILRASAELSAWTVTSRPLPHVVVDSEASGECGAADQQQGRESERELSHDRSNGDLP